ncbi:MAG: hypothetical protein QGH65_08865 [SAR324 cluster bacterium]|nr:hypothetical protein [SAR324 cluster bacterium]
MSEKSSNQGVLFLKEVNGKWVWFKDGDEKTDLKYEGEISNEVPNGQGTLTYPDGQKYEGEWKDGEWNGQGIFTISDGTKYVGEFKDGTDWNTTGYDKDGNIIGRYVNGTEQ